MRSTKTGFGTKIPNQFNAEGRLQPGDESEGEEEVDDDEDDEDGIDVDEEGDDQSDHNFWLLRQLNIYINF